MTDRFVSYKTGPAFGPGEPGAVIRRGRAGTEMVNLIWGLSPKVEGGRPFTTVRAEGRRFASGRCLIPASEFFLSTGFGGSRRKWRFSLANDDWFYFAGIWRPAQRGWPPAYAVLTIPASADVAPFHDRQMAVILRPDRMAWLDLTRPEAELLRPLPARSFRVEQVAGPSGEQPAFSF
jgi:putative SOS response-associated peptidase YedK